MTEDRDVPPSRLFKYRACQHVVDPTGRASTVLARDREIIVGNMLWAGSPLAFNDPFDCMPIIDLSGTPAEKRAWAVKQARRDAPEGGRRERLARKGAALRAMKHWTPPFAKSEGREAWRALAKITGVVSFAGVEDSMLMWSYYAQSHQGYCLGFDTSVEPFPLAHRVEYVEDRPTFRVLDPIRGSELMTRTTLHKARQWRHEQEWRILRPHQVGPLPFPKSALVSLTFGANISADHEATLRALVDERGGGVELRRVKLHADTFDLIIVPA